MPSVSNAWEEWQPDLEQAPQVPAARQRLLGTPISSYHPHHEDEGDAGLDSKGRMRLPRGAMCDFDVEELALPPTDCVPVEILEVNPLAREYFTHYTNRMLHNDKSMDWNAHHRQKSFQAPELEHAETRLR